MWSKEESARESMHEIRPIGNVSLCLEERLGPWISNARCKIIILLQDCIEMELLSSNYEVEALKVPRAVHINLK